MFQRAAASLASSMSTFKNTTFGYFPAKLVKRGAMKRQGPHQVAVKYRTARRDELEAAFNFFSSSTAERIPITCPVNHQKSSSTY